MAITKDSELKVVRHTSDGRCRYDEKGKRAIIETALRPDVSVARLAQEHGINVNLLRKWITKYLLEREKGVVAQQGSDNGKQGPPIVIEMNDDVTIDLPRSRKSVPAVTAPSAFVSVLSAPPVAHGLRTVPVGTRLSRHR